MERPSPHPDQEDIDKVLELLRDQRYTHRIYQIKSWIVSIRACKNRVEEEKHGNGQQYHTRWINNTSSTGDNKRILIVDDEPDVAYSFKSALEDNGFQERVDTFNDPLLALKHFKAGSYELVILDIVMPQMDGFELSDELKNRL